MSTHSMGGARAACARGPPGGMDTRELEHAVHISQTPAGNPALGRMRTAASERVSPQPQPPGSARSTRDPVDRLRPVCESTSSDRLANAAIQALSQLGSGTLAYRPLAHPPVGRCAPGAGSAEEAIRQACERFWSKRPAEVEELRPRQNGRCTSMYELGVGPGDASASRAGPARGDVVPMRLEQLSLPSASGREDGQPNPHWLGAMSPFYRAHHQDVTEFIRIPEPPLSELLEVRSYEDPLLRQRDERGFLRRVALASQLWDAAVIRVVACNRTPGEHVGTFATHKRAGEQRLVWDMRRSNARFARPPKVQNQASPEAFGWAEVDCFEGCRSFDGFAGDLQDMFYELLLHPEAQAEVPASPCIAEWMCVGVSYGELMDYRGQACRSEMRHLPLAANAVLMGWTWGVYLAQDVLEQRLANADLGGRMVHGKPPAVLDRADALLSFGFIDDFGGLGVQSAAVGEAQERVDEEVVRAGLHSHPRKRHRGLPLPALGAEFDSVETEHGQSLEVRPAPDKAWSARTGLYRMALAGSARAGALRHVVALTTWLVLICRSVLSVFSEVYREVGDYELVSDDQVLALSEAVRAELLAAACLLPLVRADLTSRWHGTVVAVDAGPEGAGVVYAECGEASAAHEGRLGVRPGWDVLPRDADEQLEACAERTGVVPVGVEWGPDGKRWRLAFRFDWQDPAGEHNTIQEARVLVAGLAWLVRARAARGRRLLLLTDSLAALGAFGKGRSSSPRLLRLCRRACAILLASGCRLALRYVPTWLNPADAPSRGARRPGVDAATQQKAREKHVRRGWALPRELATNAGRRRRQARTGLRRGDENSLIGDGPRPKATPKPGAAPARRARLPRPPPLAGRGSGAWGVVATPVLSSGRRVKRLQVHTVMDRSAATYARHVRAFLEWAIDVGREEDDDLDDLLADYLDVCCYERRDHVNVGATTYAGLLWLAPELELVGSKRSLKGWERLGQRGERRGFSEEILGSIINAMLQDGNVLLATLTAVGFDSYARIRELLALRLEDVPAATLDGTVTVALALGVRCRGEATKTGSEQGVTVRREWVSAVLLDWLALRRRAVRSDRARVFPIQYSDVLAEWHAITKRLGLDWIGGLHALRHSGASVDYAHGRTLNDIRVRGRWKVMSSVRRYAKPWALVTANKRAPASVVDTGERFLRDPLAFWESRKPKGEGRKVGGRVHSVGARTR